MAHHSYIYNQGTADLSDLTRSPVVSERVKPTYDYLCNSHLCCKAKNKTVDINIVKIANTKLLFDATCECGSVMFTRIYNPLHKSKANHKYRTPKMAEKSTP